MGGGLYEVKDYYYRGVDEVDMGIYLDNMLRTVDGCHSLPVLVGMLLLFR